MEGIIQFRNVSKHFDALKVLDEVDLTISRGEVVVLIGPSGSGKSTLLRCINGLEAITGGDLVVDGISVLEGKARLRTIRQEAGMVFQQFNLFPQFTALENVAFGPRKVRGASRSEARDQAMALLEKVGLAERANHYPSELSGGQQQRVAIARALALQPRIMLFDEVTASLDPELVVSVLNVIDKICADFNLTVLMVTHQIEFTRHFADRVCFFDEGRILEQGPPLQVLKDPKQERTRTFLTAIKDL